jgi:hypothetical protein
MNWVWRALVAVVLVGGPTFWLSATTTDAAFHAGDAPTIVHAPAGANKDDPDDLCGSGNPRKQKKCHFNGWDLNTNGNGNDNVPLNYVDPNATGAQVVVDGLSVALWRSAESPVINAPISLAVTGDGAAIERVWWWAEGPVYTGPFVDDLAFVGEQSHDCGGAQPCSWSWPAVTRYLGPYTLHARVRDVNGREVQTDWKFESVQHP